MSRRNRILKKAFKVLGITILSIIGLLVVLIVVIRIPAVQQRIASSAENFLEEQIGTEVSIGYLYLSFPKALNVNDLYLEDQQSDTLLYLHTLSVDTDLWALLNRTIELNSIELEGLVSNVHRFSDSTFNFTYIIEAFNTGEPAPQTTSEPWNFAIEDLTLHDVQARYQDELVSSLLALNLGNLEIEFDEVDPNESIFHIANISLANTRFSYEMGDPSPALTEADEKQHAPQDTASAGAPLDVQVANVEILSSSFFYKTPQQNYDLTIGTFQVTTNHMDLEKNLYDVERILLENSTAIMAMADSQPTPDDTVASTPSEPLALDVRLAALSMAGNEVRYTLGEPDSASPGFNPNNISIEQLEAELRDLRYQPNLAKGTLNHFSFDDPDGLALDELQADFRMDSVSFTLSNFHLATANSQVNLRAQAKYTTLEAFMNPETTVEVALDNSKISPQDVLYLNPQLRQTTPVDFDRLEPVELAAKVQGTLHNMNIDDFRFSIGRTLLTLSGTVGNITQPESLSFNINQSLTTTQAAIRHLLPDSLYPSGINLPESIVIHTSVSGTMNDLQGDVKLTSSLGDFQLNGGYAMGADSIPHYDISLATAGFDLGTLMDQPEQFGQLVMDLSADGSGASPETVNVLLKGTVSRFDFQQYTYNDLMVDGRLKEGMFDGKLELDDENLSFTFDGSVDQMAPEKSYRISLDLKKVDLEALNFSQTPLTLSARIKSDIKTEDFQRFNGDISIHEFSADNGIEVYYVDSLLFSSIDQEGNTEITIDSDLMAGKFVGNVNLPSLPQTLTNHFNYYYTLQDTIIRDTLPDQRFELSLDLRKTDLITDILVPQLQSFNPGRLEASFDSKERDLDFRLDIRQINYNDMLVDSLGIFATSDPDHLTTGIIINGLSSASLSLPQLKLTAEVGENLFNTRLEIMDSVEEKKFHIAGQFLSGDSTYEFSLNPDSLILAYEKWTILESNTLYFMPDGFEANDFILAQGQQQIAIETPEKNQRISFKEFQLKTIADAISNQDSLLTGTLNGFIQIEPIDTTFGFTADISLANIAYLTEQIGTLNLKAEKAAGEAYRVNLASTGANRFELEGAYYPVAVEQTAFDLNLSHIDLSSFSALTAGATSELYGTITGNISITGNPADPDINGSLNFKETGINPTAIGTRLKLDDETLTIKNSTFLFNNFQIKDNNDHIAALNGSLEAVDATFYRLDLNLQTTDFMILDSESGDNDMYYGTLVLDADVDITGTSVQPDVNVTIEIKEESDVSYVIPESEYTALDQSNVVMFKPPPGADSLKSKTNAMDTVTREFLGVELTANIEINEDATFHIIIDPLTGDQLSVQGSANLTVDMNRQGDLQLAGRYALNSGTYNFSFYRLVKREFNIAQGSTITWTGDPLDANLDIRASYQLETSSIELLDNQIPNRTSPEYNQYRQLLPFLVHLNIRGQLTEPEISFELDMPMAERNAFGGAVYARLQDINTRESDLNKQVFALLLLQRFISDDPFSSEGGASLADNTRRSVSRIMSDQLNRLTDDIEGVDLTFDLQSYEDYSADGSQGRTDLEVGLSRNLFSDRVTVKVTGNVNLEGGNAQRTATDYIGDLIIEYKITKDGRLRASAFRRTDFDVINGEIIETGTGLIYVREYDVFKELFNFNEQEE